MKTIARTRKKSISLNEPIDKDYMVTLQPGERITLEEGATFNGEDVAGQIFSNTREEITTFRFFEKGGELELIKVPLQASDFHTSPLLPITELSIPKKQKPEHKMKMPKPEILKPVDFSTILPGFIEEDEEEGVETVGETIIHTL